VAVACHAQSRIVVALSPSLWHSDIRKKKIKDTLQNLLLYTLNAFLVHTGTLPRWGIGDFTCAE
jgi:hypothetical protein